MPSGAKSFIAWTIADQDLRRHMAWLGYDELR